MKKPSKRHHYISETYFDNFCLDTNNVFFVYDKENERESREDIPKNIGFKKHYHAFKKEDGTIDHNTIEKMFSAEVEKYYTPIINKLKNQEQLSNEEREKFCLFLSLLRVRTPSQRDIIENHLQNFVKQKVLSLHAQGLISDPPKSIERNFKDFKEFCDKGMDVDILPQKTLEIALEKPLNNICNTLYNMEFNIYCITGRFNKFITSDNPLFWYNTKKQFKPYNCFMGDNDSEFIISLSENMVLVANNLSDTISNIKYKKIHSFDKVVSINKKIVKSAYREVYSTIKNLDKFVQKNK